MRLDIIIDICTSRSKHSTWKKHRILCIFIPKIKAGKEDTQKVYDFSEFVRFSWCFREWDEIQLCNSWSELGFGAEPGLGLGVRILLHASTTAENLPVSMRTRCHTSLAFLLKVINFLQAFVGICIVFYSLWMLNQWSHHIPVPSPPAPSPDSSQFSFLISDSVRISDDKIDHLAFAAGMVSGADDNGLVLQFINLPAPWYLKLFSILCWKLDFVLVLLIILFCLVGVRYEWNASNLMSICTVGLFLYLNGFGFWNWYLNWLILKFWIIRKDCACFAVILQ